MTDDYPTEKERCSCGCWMKEFDTSFYVPELKTTIPHAMRMCVNPRCSGSVSKDFIPPVPRESDKLGSNNSEEIFIERQSCGDCQTYDTCKQQKTMGRCGKYKPPKTTQDKHRKRIK